MRPKKGPHLILVEESGKILKIRKNYKTQKNTGKLRKKQENSEKSGKLRKILRTTQKNNTET